MDVFCVGVLGIEVAGSSFSINAVEPKIDDDRTVF